MLLGMTLGGDDGINEEVMLMLLAIILDGETNVMVVVKQPVLVLTALPLISAATGTIEIHSDTHH